MQDNDTGADNGTFDPAPGDIIRTRTGKYDGVVLRVVRATPADEAARMVEKANRTGSGPLPTKSDYVVYRVLRDGKPYGPERTAAPDTLIQSHTSTDDRDLAVHGDTFKVVDLFRALAEHVKAHPALADTLSALDVRDPMVQVYPWHSGGHLDVLNQWAATLTDRSDVRVRRISVDGNVHLALSGRLTTGTMITVIVVVDRDEAATRLAGRIPELVPGVTFPVAVLDQASTAPAVEAVAS